MATDFASVMGRAQSLVPDPVEGQLRRQMGELQLQGAALQNQAQAQALTQAKTALERQQGFKRDMTTFVANPTPRGLATLIGNYPEQAKPAQEAWAALDDSRKRADLTQMGSAASLAAKGDFKGAAALIQRRVDADRAAGLDPGEDQILLDHLNSDDLAQQKAGLAMLTFSLGIAAGPEHAGAFLKANGLSQEPIIRSPEVGTDIVSIDPLTGKATTLYQNPYVKGADGTIYERSGAGSGSPGGEPAPGAGVSPPVVAVSSTLASAGLPAPVVAGFMGNFHAEGGYGGARGDGGSARGIAQWRSDRLASFERVIGKPVTQATPAEQANFVVWEMQNPEAAGMTVAQRDAILAAKTPAQAAALIDRYYERSSGKDRKTRMQAATAFAGGSAPTAAGAPPGLRVVVPGKRPDPPAGYRFKADGTLEVIPGGPADKQTPPVGYRYKRDGSTLEPIPGGPADGERLDPDTLKMMAEQYLAGDKSVLMNLGRGKQGAANIAALRGEVGRQAAAMGMTGRDIAAQIAEFTGLVAGERTLGTRTANAEMAATEFERLAPLALQTSQSASRSGFVPFAKAQQMLQSGANDPNLRRFVAANNSLINVYARAISPSGVPTVADKEHAREILSTAYDAPSYQAVVGQMRQEISAARRSPGDVRGEFRRAISGNVPTMTPQQVRAAPSGTVFRTTDGRLMKKR